MADEATVVQDPGFEPEPIPDSIADTELTGLAPAEPSTDEQPVEPSQDETSEQQPEEAEPTDDAEESEPLEDNTEEPEQPAQPQEEQPQLDPKEVARQQYEARQARRDYVQEQRSQVRQYEAEVAEKTRTGELDELAQIKENQRIIQANQYIDTVERNRMAVINEGQRALSEIPFFKAETPQSKVAYEQSLQQFREAYGVYDEDSGELVATEDRNGNPISLYNYLAQQASIYEQVTADTQRQAQKSEAKMRAKAVSPTNPGKVTSSGDELDDLLDRIGDIPLV